MENRIPDKTIEKIFHLIQKSGVEEKKVLEVKKLVDPKRGEKIIQDYIQKGVVGNLNLSGNLIVESLPEGLKCKELNLIGNKTLKHLPKMEAEVIWAEDTNIGTIGEGLKCIILHLSGNKVLKHLPKVEAEGVLIGASNTNIQSIEDGLKCGHLNLYANKMLKKFPRNLEVGELVLADTYFSQTYIKAEVRKLIEDNGGTVDEILM